MFGLRIFVVIYNSRKPLTSSRQLKPFSSRLPSPRNRTSILNGRALDGHIQHAEFDYSSCKTTTRLQLLKATIHRKPAGRCFLGDKVWQVSSNKHGSGLINMKEPQLFRGSRLLLTLSFFCGDCLFFLRIAD